MLKVICFVAGWTATTALGAYVFGESGSNGANATRGADGRSFESLTVNVDGSARSYVLRGTDGGDASGSGHNGTPAYSCSAPREPSYNLVGASGGNGGNGARGGNGGNGGHVYFYMSGADKIPLLKKITLKNGGGKPGANAPFAGDGAPGCACADYEWYKRQCTWAFYRIIPAQNGQPEQKYRYTSETTDCTYNSQPPYNHYGEGNWELENQNQETYRCTNGASGSDGNSGGAAQHGNYGDVSVILGATSETKFSPTLSSTISETIGKSYLFSGLDRETRTGLKSLLAQGSDVWDEFLLRKYFERKVKVEWRPKLTPQEAGMEKEKISISLAGNAAAPTADVWLGNVKMTYKVINKDDTTTVAITHILNNTDPKKIAACTKNSGKGAYLCTFSDQCIYEDGDCLPK